MNALQLIEAIAEQAGTSLYDDDVQEVLGEFEVRIAQQPSWPFEYNIGQIVGPAEIEDASREDAECPEHPQYLIGHAGCDFEPEPVEHPKVIFIAEAGQIGYLPGEVKRTLGWGR